MLIIIAFTVLFATIIGSISGIGGGILIKPMMDAFCDLSSSQINFMSGTTVLVMTISSLIRSRKDLNIEKRTVMLAIGAAIGGFTGRQIFSVVKETVKNDSVIGLIQNIIMVLMVVTVFTYTLEKGKIKTKNITQRIISAVVGMLMGLLSSFLGIGGGPVNIMVLSYCFSMDSKTAALNSLFVIFFSQMLSFATTCLTKTVPVIDSTLLSVMLVLAVAGSIAGRKIARTLDNKKTDRLFMSLMILIIIVSLYNCFKFAIIF